MHTSGRRYFKRMIIYFAIVQLICVAGLAAVLYRSFSGVIEDEMQKVNIANLNFAIKNMESSLKTVEDLSVQLAMDVNVAYFMRNEFQDDYLRLYQLSTNIDRYRAVNPLMKSIYVYYLGKDAIITSPDGKVNLDTFSDVSWIRDLTFQQPGWLPQRLGPGGDTVLSYVRYMSIGALKPEGAILINVDLQTMEDIYRPMDGQSSGLIVLDERGNTLMSAVERDISIDSVIREVTQARSGHLIMKFLSRQYSVAHETGKNNWKYIMLAPLNAQISIKTFVKQVMIIASLSILVVGAIVAFALSRRLYRPVGTLLGDIGDEQRALKLPTHAPKPGKQDEFGVIRDRILDMQSKTQKSLKYASERVVLGLLSGNITQDDLSFYDTELRLERFDEFLVILAHLDACCGPVEGEGGHWPQMMQKYISLATQAFSQCESIAFVKCVAVSDDRCACLLGIHDSVTGAAPIHEQVFTLSNHLLQDAVQNLGMDMSIGISMTGDLQEISMLYEQAIVAVNQRIFLGKNSVQYYGDINKNSLTPNLFLHKQEEDVIAALSSLDREKTQAAIKAYIKQTEQYQIDSHQQVYYLLAQLTGAMIKSAYDLGGSVFEVWGNLDVYRQLAGLTYLMDIKAFLIDMAERFIAFFEVKKDSRFKYVVEAAIEYMNSQHSDYELSLPKIADKVFMSSSYLDKIFREQTGKSVIKYLTDIRMDHAKNLLVDSNLKIETVGEKVGYLTSKGFIRAFKRNTGSTPGQYRQKLLKP